MKPRISSIARLDNIASKLFSLHLAERNEEEKYFIRFIKFLLPSSLLLLFRHHLEMFETRVCIGKSYKLREVKNKTEDKVP